MSTPVLHVEHVTMQFGGVVAVNDLSMDVYDREIVALIGPNGAGKTTAFNCITGVYEPTNGRVDFLGEPIVCNHPHGKMKKIYAGEGAERYLDQRVVSYTPDVITKRGIARTFQNIRLFKSMTVFENVLTAMHVRRTSNVFSATFRGNRKEEAAQRAKALELLKAVGLDDVKDELATALPYGKQRRLEIARALAAEPKLLLLDEPVSGLDVVAREQFYRILLGEFTETGRTFVVSTHIMEEAADLFEEVIILKEGKLLLKENTEELLESCLHISGKAEEVDRATEGLEKHYEERLGRSKSVMVRLKPGQELPDAEMTVQPMNLEKVFVALCGEEE